MTRKLAEPPMELDLDSFLDSDDEELNSVPHRTIDEILNDSDSSDSSPRLSTPSASRRPEYPHDGVSVSSPKSPADSARPAPGPSSLSRPGDPFSLGRRSSHPLPPLFGGVRSNVKPGAALAAAAAASRSVPTPHAAAIKSRRASSGISQKVLEDSNQLDEIMRQEEDSFREVEKDDTLHEGDKEFTRDDEGLGRKVPDMDTEARAEQVREEHEVGVGNADVNLSNLNSSPSKPDFEQELDSSPSVEVESKENLDKVSTELITGSTDVAEQGIDSTTNEEGLSGAVGENVTSFDANDEKNVTSLDTNDEKTVVSSLYASNEAIKGDKDATPVTSEMQDRETSIPPTDNDLSLHSEDDISLSDITELVEQTLGQLENTLISAEKSRLASVKPLELAEELEKKQAFTGLHWQEGAAAQPMRLEGVQRGSTTLGYFDVDADNTVTRKLSSHAFKQDYGSPQALAVTLNYIAVGMSKGYIIVVPSKYSAHTADIMDAKMLILGDRSHAPVTSVCFSQQGDLLLAGYGDGRVTVWDVQRASAAKVIAGEHTAPVVHTLFLGQDPQAGRNFRAITGDSKGQVLLHTFSVILLVNRFSVETQCLVDGQRTGTVLSATSLLCDEFCGGAPLSSPGNATVPTSGIGSMMGGVAGGDAGWKLFNKGSSFIEEDVVVFVTHQTALVVRLPPKLEVYAQLSKPDGVREGSIPYTAWKCVSHSRGSSDSSVEAIERVSLLAIAWDRKVQVAKLVKSELKVNGEWSLESAALGVVWLNDQMLVALTSTGQLYLFSKDGTPIHQTSFAVHGSGVDDILAYHTHLINVFGNPEKAYHNCVAVRGASIYLLGPTHLVVSRLLLWKERIQVLRKAGDWMGSLNMAITLYDGQAHGVIDLPRSLEAIQDAIMPYLVELLLSYVDEVFSYLSVACHNQYEKVQQVNDAESINTSVHSEIKEQFTRVGGVTVEFCIHIRRTDILFDEIFSRFVAVKQRETFLELLEPYILKDMLGSLPPEIMQALVEHYSGKGWLHRVEQCVLHMDISSVDFNQVVRLCREHGLYGALVYLFNKGLDDFRTPLEELLGVLKCSEGEKAQKLGYRLLVYLKYCFSGLAFPPGHGTLPSSRLPSLRTELVRFLLEVSDASASEVVLKSSSVQPYLNLYHLLEIDAEAALHVLRCAFPEDDNTPKLVTSQAAASPSLETDKGSDSIAEENNALVQDIVNSFINILDKGVDNVYRATSDDDTDKIEKWPAKKDICHLSEFIAEYVTQERAKVPKDVLHQILEYLALKDNWSPEVTNSPNASRRRGKQLLSLLKTVPETDWNASYVLQLCEKAEFHQVCGLVHTLKRRYVAALDSYMRDTDEPIHAFAYIDNTLQQLNGSESSAFCSAVISQIPQLVELSRECTFVLVRDHFKEEEPHIVNALRSHSKCLFLYLKTVVEAYLSGTLNFSYLIKDDIHNFDSGRGMNDHLNGLEAYLEKISDFPKFLRSNPVDVTDAMTELYLELLCQYERDSVLKFLETFDNYRVEHCLRLCQKYGVMDAAAFLLERVGDVGSALLLMLSSLNDKFVALDTALGNIISKLCTSGGLWTDHWSIILELKERNEIWDILHACIGLCQRNTPRLNPEESETLWFRLLDSFCAPLMDSSTDIVFDGTSCVTGLPVSLGADEDEAACSIKWKISKSHRGANILRRLFSEFIKDIVEGMIGYVRLPTIMSKLLSDNGSQEFGDFKLTILGLLGTYGFERRILDTAKSLIEDDTFYTLSILKKGASHGYAPRSLVCCICSSLIGKNASSPRIRVFSCGHATHLRCEFPETDPSSRNFASGCPICMPKKKVPKSRSKSILQQNTLVHSSTSRHQQTPGSNYLHSLENDSSENSYGLQQISRFEILSNLHKNQKSIQIENLPQIRLAPPAVYHEKVGKGSGLSGGESSNSIQKVEGQGKNRQLRDVKVKGSSLRLPLKSSIFGKEKTTKR